MVGTGLLENGPAETVVKDGIGGNRVNGRGCPGLRKAYFGVLGICF